MEPADKEDDNTEVLSSQYRPERSVHIEYRQPNGSSRPSHSDLPQTTTTQTPVLAANYHLNIGPAGKAIRSVDDYERERAGSTYYFQAASAAPVPSSSRTSSSRKSMPGGIALVRSNGDALDAESSPVKEPLTADEKKRKRITLAIGIIAGLIIFSAILLVAVTLNMTSRIDAIVKEQNDNLYAQLTSSKGDYGTAWRNASASSQSFPVLLYASRDN